MTTATDTTEAPGRRGETRCVVCGKWGPDHPWFTEIPAGHPRSCFQRHFGVLREMGRNSRAEYRDSPEPPDPIELPE